MKKLILMALALSMLSLTALAQTNSGEMLAQGADASTGALGSGATTDTNPVINAPTAADPQLQQEATGTSGDYEGKKRESVKKKTTKKSKD